MKLKPPPLETPMLAEDAAKQAIVDKFPRLARIDEDRNLTFRFYGHDHLIQITALDMGDPT